MKWETKLDNIPATKHAFGQLAETLCAKHLETQNYRIIERNFHSASGEIDIIAQAPNDYMVFIEVKAREHGSLASGFESISPEKQRRIRQTAEFFLYTHEDYQKSDCRLDAISVVRDGHSLQFEWLQDAF